MVVYNTTVRANEAGRTVRVGAGDAAYEAFVPAPLPPQVSLDAVLIKALSGADRALGELSGLGRMLPNPDLLIHPFIQKEALLSSRIEGTQATATEVYDYEADAGPTSRRPVPEDVQEVINYMEALRFGLGRIEELPVSARLIKELHEVLMRGVRGQEKDPGEFRRSQNWIGSPGCLLNDANYVPPPVAEMVDAISDLERYLHREDDLPELIRLAVIHAQFEMIHPFIDGNGRIGRLLITLLLVNWHLLPLPLLYLSAYFERERDTYYDLLLAVSDRGAWRDWILYFLRGVAEQAADATTRAKRVQDLQAVWRDKVTHARSSALLLRLVDNLFVSPVLTIPRAERLLGVTYPAAKANVEKLVEAGILAPFGEETYGRRFWAPAVLDAIGE